MMAYSAMQRFRDALKGVPQDRVPLFPMIAGWAAVNFSSADPARIARDSQSIIAAQIKAVEAVGYDAFYAYADPLYIPEAFGCEVRFLETGPLAAPLPITINRLSDVDRLPVPRIGKAEALSVILETVRGLNTYGKGHIPVLGLIEGPFTTTCRIIEAELVMRMLYRNPRVLEALLDKVTGFLIDFGRALIDNGANVIFLPEPTASASMISPAVFCQFVLPRIRKLTGKLKAPCVLHICGNTSPVLDAIGQTGADVLSLDQCMDLDGARAKLPQTVLGGNVDPIKSLLYGTREEIAEDTLNALRTGGTGRFILMSGCGVPPRTPVENVATMVKTVKEYGLGPET